MNRVYRTTITISFDVWEPQQDAMKDEIDQVVRAAKAHLTHAARLRVASEQHEETVVA